MWGISGFAATRHAQFWDYTYNLGEKSRLLDFGSITITMSAQRSQFLNFSGLPVPVEFRGDSTRAAFKGSSIRMTLVDERLLQRRAVVKPADILAYDLVQGADVLKRALGQSIHYLW